MRTAKFQYKCRKCGGIEENPCTAETNAYLILVSTVFKLPIPANIAVGMQPDLLGVHHCNDNQVGVSDLIGYELYDE